MHKGAYKDSFTGSSKGAVKVAFKATIGSPRGRLKVLAGLSMVCKCVWGSGLRSY